MNGLIEKAYLGGSRRMAEKFPELIQVSEKTDWDYNVQHSDEIVSEILSHGFEEQIGNPEYKDNQAVKFFKRGNLSFVTRHSLLVYEKAFELMNVDEYRETHWKSSPFLKTRFNRIVTKEYFNNLFRKVETDNAK